jgi:hypothetical protein
MDALPYLSGGLNPLVLVMVQLLLISQLLACGPGARETASRAYAKEMQTLWGENLAIGREFMDVATRLKKDTIDPHDVAKRFDMRVIPRARKLADKVGALRADTESLQQVHAGIVRAWEIRADSYEQMNTAWLTADMQAYTRALSDNRSVRKAEDRYLEAANTLLAPYQVALDPNP